MSTEFISFQPAPGDALHDYKRELAPFEQPSSIPPIFIDAMSVREEVYVKEQKVPLENEFDDDDARSYHWVVYASVGNSSSSGSARASGGDVQSVGSRTRSTSGSGVKYDDNGRRKSSTTASRVAVGTIRLVPPPHPPHPTPGSSHKIDNNEGVPRGDMDKTATAPDATVQINKPSEDQHEPFIKLGRLATLSAFRRLGLSNLVINAALSWASTHPQEVAPRPSAAHIEEAKLEGRDVPEPWKGLVLVHAQESVEKVWKKHGFVRDEKMGVWDEEGIKHIGMWRRLEIRKDSH
ncbi:hypothetical protein LTS18_004400 [Coniosporium uncinatum]|uniref:Uncharacterized protein n=1 Tax=Coniosporium uncinatum TaxID=93489 RepID=A0ACC3DBB5_9PEZI|nr:hypothetical protein LTS18_004400 [Coniosporium uncinatum]